MSEPHWATELNEWGEPKGRYSFHGWKKGWSCHHCGGLFRSKTSLLEHQARMIAKDAPMTDKPEPLYDPRQAQGYPSKDEQ